MSGPPPLPASNSPGGAPPPLPSAPTAAPPPVHPEAPPPKKKSSALTWILLGCGAFLLVGALAIGGLAYWGYTKAKEISGQPTLYSAKAIALGHPEIEIVSADEATGKVTIRDTKTKQLATMDLMALAAKLGGEGSTPPGSSEEPLTPETTSQPDDSDTPMNSTTNAPSESLSE